MKRAARKRQKDREKERESPVLCRFSASGFRIRVSASRDL